LLHVDDAKILNEIHKIRKTTSKKDADVRRTELCRAMSQPLLDLIAGRPADLLKSSFGCQFLAEVLLGGIGEKQEALRAVAGLSHMGGDVETQAALQTPHAGRLLKTLVQGGRFDRASKSVVLVEPQLLFGDMLYENLIEDMGTARVLQWALGANSWVIVALLESPEFEDLDGLVQTLKYNRERLLEGTDNLGTRTVLETMAKLNLKKSGAKKEDGVKKEEEVKKGDEK